jgi:DNA-binding NtrC family response regulator
MNVDVLIRGETGVGKELVAHAIHKLSGRKGPFVTLNLAAIPDSLAVAELSGHQRGAFTGAVESRAGHFELAHLGTVFVDEIETTSDTLQGMIAEFLRTREVRRLGSSKAAAVDVRVVAATDSRSRRLHEHAQVRGCAHPNQAR